MVRPLLHDVEATGGAPRPTTVIVDKESLYRWFVSESLRARGVDVVCCSTLGEAETYLTTHPGTGLLLVDEPTIHGDGERALATLHRLSQSVPCVVLDVEPDAVRFGPRALPVVDKPDDSDGLAVLVGQRMRPVG